MKKHIFSSSSEKRSDEKEKSWEYQDKYMEKNGKLGKGKEGKITESDNFWEHLFLE